MQLSSKAYKVLIFIGIIILICIGVLFFKGGYLPVAGNMIAEKKLTDYSDKQIQSGSEIETEYDWYNGRYRSIGEGKALSYRLNTNMIYDERLIEQIDSMARSQYESVKEALPQTFEFDSGVYVWTGINAGDYSVKSQRVYLTGIYNSAHITEEESRKMPADIARQVIDLMGETYNFTGIQLIYHDRNGGYTIEIPSDSFEPLRYEDMLEKTRKLKQEELGEMYTHWLDQLIQ